MKRKGKIIEWIEKNKQIGKRYYYLKGDMTIWSSVGIQKWNGRYKVYIDEIEECSIDIQDYLREEIRCFDSMEDALLYIDAETQLDVLELEPLKGQKIFNPSFN